MSAARTVPPQKKFTRDEVQRLMDEGPFAGQRFELIEGDLIDKMGQNPRHAFAIQLLTEWLAGIFRLNLIRIQSPIEASPEDRQRSWPEPDIAVLRELKSEYRQRHPDGDELHLLVEIADSSGPMDLKVKAKLYARAGVPEYWVLDIANRSLVVHRLPANGEYQNVTQFGEWETVSLGSASTTVAALLP